MGRLQKTHRRPTTARSGGPARLSVFRVFAVALVTALFGVLLLASIWRPAAHATTDADPVELLAARFAAMPGLSARFREEKHLALLRAPLLSEGRLYFAPAGYLLRHVDSPIPSSVLIRDGRLSMVTGQSHSSIDLESNPAVRVFVDSLRLFLSGDLAALRVLYRVEMLSFETGEQDAWTLSLEPLQSVLRSSLKSIELRGNGSRLGELRVLEAGGDLSITRFFDVNIQRHFGGAERDSIFRLPAS
jgi:hypothetical protein